MYVVAADICLLSCHLAADPYHSILITLGHKEVELSLKYLLLIFHINEYIEPSCRSCAQFIVIRNVEKKFIEHG
jgi:hypothetical protein